LGINHAAKNDYDLVFPASNGKWLCRRNWQRRGFNIACIEAGLVEPVKDGAEILQQPKYRPYDLRHFFASMHIEKHQLEEAADVDGTRQHRDNLERLWASA
jgi:integrase